MTKLQISSLLFLIFLTLGSLYVGFFEPAGTFETNATKALEAPSFEAFLGRDGLGRNLLYRVLEGAQVSITIGLLSSALAFLLGLTVGGVVSMLPKKLEAIFLRGIEILIALPHLMLLAILFLLLQSSLGHSASEFILIVGSLALGSWMSIARITRNLLRAEMTKEYIEGALAIGAGWPRILSRHLLPNIASTLLAFWSLQIPQALLAEGALSFLGFGVKAPHVSWGLLLQDGWRSLSSYPHLLLGPSLALFLTVLSLNILLRRVD